MSPVTEFTSITCRGESDVSLYISNDGPVQSISQEAETKPRNRTDPNLYPTSRHGLQGRASCGLHTVRVVTIKLNGLQVFPV